LVLRECPYCHRPFEAQLLSKEKIDSSQATKVGDFPIEMSSLGGLSEGGLTPVDAGGLMGMVLGLDESTRNAIALQPEAFITYRMTYRCKHRGKEWTRTSAETIPLPRDHVIDEEERTDADADTEREEARDSSQA
jgi:hypothetical protein